MPPVLLPSAPSLRLHFAAAAASSSRRATVAVAPAASRRSSSSVPFDAAAFEAERLRLDADARASTAAGADPRAWKWRIRKRVWDVLEAEGVARNPRPVHHRIPNFDGAAAAADSVRSPSVSLLLLSLAALQENLARSSVPILVSDYCWRYHVRIVYDTLYCKTDLPRL
jgi:hypothetical protein